MQPATNLRTSQKQQAKDLALVGHQTHDAILIAGRDVQREVPANTSRGTLHSEALTWYHMNCIHFQAVRNIIINRHKTCGHGIQLFNRPANRRVGSAVSGRRQPSSNLIYSPGQISRSRQRVPAADHGSGGRWDRQGNGSGGGRSGGGSGWAWVSRRAGIRQ